MKMQLFYLHKRRAVNFQITEEITAGCKNLVDRIIARIIFAGKLNPKLTIRKGEFLKKQDKICNIARRKLTDIKAHKVYIFVKLTKPSGCSPTGIGGLGKHRIIKMNKKLMH